ncbi:translocation/assembly module TamB domain-containing protein [Maricaulis sp.]|uniref:translocation/assembly module TamB domain-containing protein n=1 Tax=Maricaulis sp. TaxID=1486257 RepID=UPI002B271AC0|nr:translocation/assembly module TamB domain-containing protein [Maricaulis sp.]
MTHLALIRRLALWAGLILLGVALLASGLRLAAGQAPGRWLVSNQLDGRYVPGVGRLSVSGVRGDPLSRLQIDQLTLSDDNGVWLTAESISLDWQARSLLSGPIRINEALIERVTIIRRPVLDSEPARPSGGRPDAGPTLPAIDLVLFNLSRLELADGVAGPQALLTARAGARLRAGASNLSVQIARLDAEGDHLEADLLVGETGVTGTLSAHGEAGGTLATLMRLPDQAIRIDGYIDGDLTAGRGELTLTADTRTRAQAGVTWNADSWQGDATVNVAAWDLVPEPLAPEVEAVRVQADGRRSGPVTVNRVTLEANGSRVVLRDLTAPLIQAEFTISPALVARLSGDRVVTRSVSGSADVARGDGLEVQLRPQIEGLELAGLSVQRLDGSMGVTRTDGRPRLTVDLNLDGVQTGRADVDRLANGRIRVTGNIADAGGDTGWQMAPGFTVASEQVTAIASGHLPPDATWPVGEVSISLTDAALAQPDLSGPARAEISIAADRAIAINIDGSALIWPETVRGLLDGITARARINPSGAGWTVSDFNARSPAFDLALTGAFADALDWSATGDLALSGAIPLAAAEIDGGLATAFRLVRDQDALRLRAVTTSRQLHVGPVHLQSPRLGVRGRLGGVVDDAATTLEWVFSADRELGDVAANGTARHQTGRTDLVVTQGRFDDVTLSGSATLAGQDMTVALEAQREDLMSLSGRFVAALDNLRAGQLDAELTLAAQRIGEADLNAAGLTLSGPLTGIAVTAQADGRIRSNVDLSATGEIALGEDGVSVSLSPSGKWAAHNWTTVEPIRLATRPDGVTASAAITLGGGRVDLTLQTAGISPIASLTIDSVPVGVLADIAAMPATQGMISGTADLRETSGVWRGNAAFAATGLLTNDLPDMPELDLQLEVALQDDARSVIRLTGGGLEARGEIVRAGATTDIARPQGAADATLTGQIAASGELIALAALFLPSDILLESGQVDAQLVVSGTVSEPHLEGGVSLTGGRINATTAGSVVSDLELDLALAGTRLELTRLSASDAREGQLTGQGQLDLGEDSPPTGSARFEFQRFVAVRRPELTVQGSGDIVLTLDEDGLLIGGESRVDQLRTQPTLNGAASIPQLQVVEINQPKDHRASTESRLPVRIDYRVRASNGLYVSSRAFTSEWGVDLHVTGTESKPSLFGSATLVGGSAFVFNRRFTLADGTVTFDGSPSDARVDLSAVHSRTGFEATARVTGSAQEPTITLTSDPALPEDEILSRLLFDQSVSQLGAFEAAQLAAQLSGQSLLDVVGQLRDLAGIDRLDISTNADGNLSVVGGRRFGDNVYVEVGSNGASAINEALIEWSLTPDLSILSRVSADTDAAVSIRWRRDY